ncbi:unannotated protein [freshwater metagenome]|uniref:Unannotated protein n=1 Tax=freshwater metagenome TaxID=449393 RepID=A0A6J6W9C6_9ZZZZ
MVRALFFVTWFTDTKPNTNEFLGADVRGDTAQSIVTTKSAALFDSDSAGFEIEFILDNDESIN